MVQALKAWRKSEKQFETKVLPLSGIFNLVGQSKKLLQQERDIEKSYLLLQSCY